MKPKFLITPKPFGNHPLDFNTFQEAQELCEQLNKVGLPIVYSVARIWTQEDERAWTSMQSSNKPIQ